MNSRSTESKAGVSKIFVYGTLKPGGRNYFLAEGVTHAEPAYLDGYDLLHFEPEGYPAMIPGRGRVYGFILTFADIEAALPALDALEGLHLSPPEYERVVVVQPSGKRVWTYVYINETRLAASGIIPVVGGDWAHKLMTYISLVLWPLSLQSKCLSIHTFRLLRSV